MSDSVDTIEVRANVIMTTESLKAIVDHARNIAGRNEKGHFQVDTAGWVGRMVSRFLLENDFEAYVQDEHNYRELTGPESR